MADDRSSVEVNTRERERLRALVVAGKIDRGEPWVSSDAEPDGD